MDVTSVEGFGLLGIGSLRDLEFYNFEIERL